MFGSRNGQYLGTQLPFFSSQTLTKGSSTPTVVVPAAIHFWPMNEGSGSTFVDNIGTTNLTTTNVTWAIASGLGAAAVSKFSSNGSAIAAAVDASLNFNGTQPMTVAVWANVNIDNSSTICGNLMAPTTYAGWEVGLTGTNGAAAPALLVVGAVTSNQMTATGPSASGTAAGILLVYTYTGSLTLAGVKIYINGINQTPLSDSSATLTSGATSTQPFVVGARGDATSGFNGSLAFMRVWNSVLTPAQISKLYSLGPQ